MRGTGIAAIRAQIILQARTGEVCGLHDALDRGGGARQDAMMDVLRGETGGTQRLIDRRRQEFGEAFVPHPALLETIVERFSTHAVVVDEVCGYLRRGMNLRQGRLRLLRWAARYNEERCCASAKFQLLGTARFRDPGV